MSTEERFTKIENALAHIAELQANMQERQAKADEEIAELRDLHKGVVVAIGKLAEFQRETNKTLDVLIQAQTETEEKLQRWIEHSGNEPKGAQ